jgi:hypothetical protein
LLHPHCLRSKDATDRYKLLTLNENPVILANRQHKSLMKGGCFMQVPTPIVCCAANCG